jgi:hypothetical protein
MSVDPLGGVGQGDRDSGVQAPQDHGLTFGALSQRYTVAAQPPERQCQPDQSAQDAGDLGMRATEALADRRPDDQAQDRHQIGGRRRAQQPLLTESDDDLVADLGTDRIVRQQLHRPAPEDPLQERGATGIVDAALTAGTTPLGRDARLVADEGDDATTFFDHGVGTLTEWAGRRDGRRRWRSEP